MQYICYRKYKSCYRKYKSDGKALSPYYFPQCLTSSLAVPVTAIAFLSFFFFLFLLCCGMWDLNSLIRDQTRLPCTGSMEP